MMMTKTAQQILDELKAVRDALSDAIEILEPKKKPGRKKKATKVATPK